MEKELLDKVSPEVVEFIAKSRKNTNDNPHFQETLKREIEKIKSNVGYVISDQGILRGSYRDEGESHERLISEKRYKMTAVSKKGISIIFIDCPEYDYRCENENDIHFQKRIQNDYSNSIMYQPNENKAGEISELKELRKKVYVSPKLVHTEHQHNSIKIEYDENGQDISYLEKEKITSGYQDPQTKEFVKYGRDIPELTVFDITREGNYGIVKKRNVLRSDEITNQVFSIEAAECSLADIANLRHVRNPLTASNYHQLKDKPEVTDKYHVKIKK